MPWLFALALRIKFEPNRTSQVFFFFFFFFCWDMHNANEGALECLRACGTENALLYSQGHVVWHRSWRCCWTSRKIHARVADQSSIQPVSHPISRSSPLSIWDVECLVTSSVGGAKTRTTTLGSSSSDLDTRGSWPGESWRRKSSGHLASSPLSPGPFRRPGWSERSRFPRQRLCSYSGSKDTDQASSRGVRDSKRAFCSVGGQPQSTFACRWWSD